ncbi:MAG TPA: PQQ-binding-like beta-propeller repeat protein [Methanomassiliicoccales archaeon]|nr:PQQ-binding-like beta-propeller repeat protein [Methanomassiliicoccales archaeon]
MGSNDEEIGLSRVAVAFIVTALLLGTIITVLYYNDVEDEPLEIIWLDPSDQGGYDRVMDLTEGHAMIFEAAKGMRSGEETFTVRALSAISGESLWSSHLDLGAGINAASSVAVEGEILGATGFGETVGGEKLMLVTAFNAITGGMLWNDVVDLGGGFAEGNSVAVSDGMVFAAGQGRTETGQDLFLVVAYDAQTGEMVWFDAYGNGGGENAALDIKATSGGIYAVGYVENGTGIKELFLRAYSPCDGEVLWEDIYNRGGWDAKASEIVVDDDSLFVAGIANDDAGDFRSILRSYGANGTLLWSHESSRDDSISDIGISKGRLYTSGVTADEFFLAAYEAQNGTLLWEETTSKRGEFNFFSTLDAEGGRVTLATFSQNVSDDAEYQWLMQVWQYNAYGKLVQHEDLAGEGSTAERVDILIHGKRIFVTNSAGRLLPKIFSSIMSSTMPDTTAVEIDGYKINVNGEEFLVKGVNYAPGPIGSDNSYCPYGDWFQPYWQTIYKRDIPRLKEMGANTVKTYAITAWQWGDPHRALIKHTDFYDTLHENGLYVIPSVYTTKTDIQNYDPATWDAQEVMQQWKAILAEGKDHPAVLGWCIGNEVNGGDVLNDEYFWKNYNDIVGHIKNLSADKMTLIALQDESESGGGIAPIHLHDGIMTNLDVWGVNSYRGTISTGFDFLFEKHKTYSEKPLLITEFGPPASTRDGSGNAVLQSNNAENTSKYIEAHWQGHDDSIMNNTDVCQGGFVFEWIDEWYKIGLVYEHDPSAAKNDAFPGGWWDEEWFGICGVSVDGRDIKNPDPGKPDILSTRASFDALKEMWNSEGESKVDI